MRPTSFALHIRPLFTEIDVQHMHRLGVDLASFTEVSSRSAVILAHLEGIGGSALMPPASTTGPWPEEWISLFRRWIAEGCPA